MDHQGQPLSRASPGRDSSEGAPRIAGSALALLLTAVVACGHPTSQKEVDEEIRAINDRLTAGDYRAAERLADEACDRVSHSSGAESVEFARLQGLLVTALVKGGKG